MTFLDTNICVRFLRGEKKVVGRLLNADENDDLRIPAMVEGELFYGVEKSERRDENREKALKLFEESANEGFKFAYFRLIEFYSKGEFKDIEKGRIWFEKAVELGFDEACFANELGVESLQCRKLKEAADAGDCVAAAKLACAYLHGVYDGGNEECVCGAKDLDKARHYGVMACMGDDGGQMLVNILGDHIVEDQKFLSEVALEAGLE